MASRTLAIFLALSAFCLQSIHCANWALLVAGSNGYINYRHQADICHAYHIVRGHGIPPENIVTMMYDDIAHNHFNPVQGNIINQYNGPNVYKGTVIDYKGEDVTPEVFLAILSGDEEKVEKLTGHKGKVIKSTSEDHVFVNFADHGGPGLIAFPEDYLYAKTLMSTIKRIHAQNKFKKMVLYVEACESGSMFYDLLPKDINVYASTASNRSQSSFACYFDPKRKVYLGDVYSVNWMQDSDKEDLQTEAIQHQFLVTKQETNTSQVKEFGDMTISQMTVAEFQGKEKMTPSADSNAPFVHPTLDAVPARDALYHTLMHRLNNARDSKDRLQAAHDLYELLKRNEEVDKLFKDIVEWLERETNLAHPRGNVLRFSSESLYNVVKEERSDISQWDCYEHALSTLTQRCPKLGLSRDYHALGQLYLLVNVCERGHSPSALATAIMSAAFANPHLCTL